MNAIDFLKGKIKDGFIRQVKGNSYAEDLKRGDANAVIGWSGDIFILKSESDGQFDFAIPESGGTLWSDNMLIPSTSTHKKNAEKSGNKLTQTINSSGELVSVKNLADDDESDENSDNDVNEDCGDSITLDDIRKQMFETENVVIDKNTDHGLSRLTENQDPQNQDQDQDQSDGNDKCIDDSFYSMN